MTFHRYPPLLVAALAAAFIGTAIAQTQSDDSSRLPAKKGTTQAEQTQPSAQQTDKMKDQNEQMAQNQSGQMGNAGPNSPTKDASQAKPKSAQDRGDQTNPQAQTSPMSSPDRSNHMKDKSAMSDHNAMSDEHAMPGKKSKSEKHAAKAGAHHQAMNSAHRHSDQSKEAAGSDDKAYREALRDCAKQQDQSQRDSCLDGAIERFHRNV
jgi:hypothetical protein